MFLWVQLDHNFWCVYHLHFFQTIPGLCLLFWSTSTTTSNTTLSYHHHYLLVPSYHLFYKEYSNSILLMFPYPFLSSSNRFFTQSQWSFININHIISKLKTLWWLPVALSIKTKIPYLIYNTPCDVFLLSFLTSFHDISLLLTLSDTRFISVPWTCQACSPDSSFMRDGFRPVLLRKFSQDLADFLYV